MSVRMRHTSSHTKNRRSHHALKKANVVVDKESGALRMPHRLDETTGMYRGVLIVPERKRALKEDKKRKEEHSHDHDHTAGVREPVHVVEAPKTESKGILGKISKGRANTRSGTA